MTNPMCDRLLIGISGSIHCVHIYDYLALFRASFAGRIRVIMTESATRMIRPETVELFTDDRVFTDTWDRLADATGAPHLQLTRWADLFVVVPATANILGKAAGGIADDLLSTAILSSPRPVVFAPAMNAAMWKSRALQRNLQALRDDGHEIVDPGPGISIASGDSDPGLAPSPELLLRHLEHIHLTSLQAEYWEEATREKPLTPAQKRLRELAAQSAPAIPLTPAIH